MSRSSKHKQQGAKWVHPPEALLHGHIVYNVKFLGHVEVPEPKGTEVVRDAIRKMKFNKQLKKAEGQKPPKVELTVSVDGVTVQEPKYKVIQHQYPLHRISYCADDKSDKRMFTFIAKEGETNKHHCFVFDSEKCAEEITLTIGQAFNLAYKKFMETSSKDMDVKKQFLLLQKKVQQLTGENLALKSRVADLERLVDPALLENLNRTKQNGSSKSQSSSTTIPEVGRKLENLLMEDEAPAVTRQQPVVNGQQTPTSPTTGLPILAPPPPVPSRNNIPARTPTKQDSKDVDLFGLPPFSSPPPAVPGGAPVGGGGGGGDPFGMPAFSPTSPTAPDLDRQLQSVDRELMDLQAGFSQGLSFGTEDFSLEDLDPLKGK